MLKANIPIEAEFPGGGCGYAGIYFCYHSNDGVIIAPWNVHLDRNIGFSEVDPIVRTAMRLK